jgi:Beta-lactamase superfamily domain
MVARHDKASHDRLESTFKSSLREAHEHRRPLLTHLNADTTWLLSLPYPESSVAPLGRCRYNILIDPWLKGSQSDVASWFSSQTHVIESSVQTVAELDSILAEAEGELLDDITETPFTCLDLVTISHEFTDHCHEATLREVDAAVPVFSTGKAVELMRSWKHFHSVTNIASFVKEIDWHTTSISPLPDWMGLGRLITEGNALYYHSAIIFCVQTSDSDKGAEAIIYTPHGVESDTFATIATATPSVETLALLHGLHDVSITLTKQLNLGAHNALKAQKLLKARYWVGTHDEVKKGAGLIGPLLRRKQLTIEDALKQATKSAAGASGNETPMTAKDVSWLELENGQSLVLE